VCLVCSLRWVWRLQCTPLHVSEEIFKVRVRVRVWVRFMVWLRVRFRVWLSVRVAWPLTPR